MRALAVVLLTIVAAGAGRAQDVVGLEICTAERDMVRRTSCLQSNVNFLQASISKEALAAKRNLDAGIAGAALTSGFYDLGTEVSVWKVYYGEDVATYADRSSLPGLVATHVPLFVNDAELDPDLFQDETAKLVAARAAAGKPLERVHLGGHSHISETYAVGTGDRSLSGPVLEFVRRVTGSE